MEFARRALLALVLCGCAPAPFTTPDASMISDASVTPDAGGEDAGPRDDFSTALENLRSEHGVPALAALELRDGEIARTAAVGLRRADDTALVTTDDRWHLGSCTKAMTAALLALVAQDGTLSLDTTLAEAFAGLEIHESMRGVTLYDLLVHRAGLEPDGTPSPETIELLGIPGPVREARAELARRVLSRGPAIEPRTETRYSNIGYILVGAALERATGASWEDLLHTRLLTPLGMTSCGFGPPAATHDDAPSGHVLSNGALEPVPTFDNPPLLGPAGTVHCTLADWARFVDWTMSPPESGPLALSTDAHARLVTPTSDGWAPGWQVTSRLWARGPVLVHGGSNTTFYVVVWALPEERRALFAATNVFGDPGVLATDGAIGWMLEHDAH
ncbi:serine hydrolase domain-containing protein [Sandaracinus amylolyticus]|uniref:serine hydrolase domain-containing protein n=1 Tax=Sandaracinus amylolyticus TaxID=927083 RepID=UPI001F26211C|nr:serine hydrolase domain-containing protein [Sandaracinus amylolyticus]UJR79659.1 D-alanyl-D-alanine carboxypeptidase [Sandaracinus amylolyticus]